MAEKKRPIRRWAFWRRFQYGFGFTTFWALIGVLVFFMVIYQAPNCFDGKLNGDETYPDAGGTCVRIDPGTVAMPMVVWTESFKVAEGQYNSVAYVENNKDAHVCAICKMGNAYRVKSKLMCENTGCLDIDL